MQWLVQSVAVVLALALPLATGSASAATVGPCVGDCQGTGTNSISSLVTLVNIALGDAPLSSCPHGVPSGAQVTVALVIQAVNNTLDGCPGPAGTPTVPLAATNTFTPTPSATVPARGATCPAGQHKVCHSGSGRGGGYHTTCTCVDNPPPRCVTAWGTQIPAGTSIVLYDTYTVHAPDTCAAHGTLVSCDPAGVLDPPGATGYPVCNVVSNGGSDD